MSEFHQSKSEAKTKVKIKNIFESISTNTESATISMIQNFLDNSGNINSQDENGKSFLIAALCENKFDVAEFLITKNINVNLCDNVGYVALHYAVDNLQITQMLVAHGASINVFSKAGLSPLNCAAEIGSSDVLDFLCRASRSREVYSQFAVDVSTALRFARHDSVGVMLNLFQHLCTIKRSRNKFGMTCACHMLVSTDSTTEYSTKNIVQIRVLPRVEA